MINMNDEGTILIQRQESKNSLKKDYKSISLLLFLYFLQGLPLGLTATIPYILSSKNVSYSDQGTFSFAFWPFSIKLLWAPLVDSIYIKKFGRRKSWLVPVQYLIGIFMFLFSDYVHKLLENDSNRKFNSNNEIFLLTVVFFMFTFMCATQDIIIDGWALTILSKENVGWSSTCNTVGQSGGYFLGNVIFLTLESADFCNKYLRPIFGLEYQNYGVVTFKNFMHFFGFVFIITTTLVMIFKKEKDTDLEDKSIESELSITGTYKLMWKLLWLAPVKELVIILLTHNIGMATESINSLKLIEYGVPKENLSLMAIPTMPLQIIIPLLLAKYTNGKKALSVFYWSIPGRLLMNAIYCIWVYYTPYFKTDNNEYSSIYYFFLFGLNIFDYTFWYGITISQVSFFAKVSDEIIGGTYMTFLNTMTNLGTDWPRTLTMYLVDFFTVKQCVATNNLLQNIKNVNNMTLILNSINNNLCNNDAASDECTNYGGECLTKFDAYYLMTFVNIGIAILWLLWKNNTINQLQELPKSDWKITEFQEGKKD